FDLRGFLDSMRNIGSLLKRDGVSSRPCPLWQGAVLNRSQAPRMNVRLVHEFRFEAAHRLPKVPAGHKCARLHGHSFKIELASRGPANEEPAWLLDFSALHDAWAPLHAELDHNYLNDVPGLENPTSEVLAKWIWDRMKPALPSLARVTVFETCDARCEYEGE